MYKYLLQQFVSIINQEIDNQFDMSAIIQPF